MPGVVHPWFSTYFLVSKPTPGEYRGILDMQGVNDHVVSRSFKMDTLRTVKEILRPDDYMTSVDISSAYPHVHVARRFRNLMCLRTTREVELPHPSTTDPEVAASCVQATGFSKFQAADFGPKTLSGQNPPDSRINTNTNLIHSEFSDLTPPAVSARPTGARDAPGTFKCQDFRFRCLPFGLKSAPRIWTRVFKPVITYLRAVHSMRLVVYLDDILICSSTREGSHRDTVTMVNVLRSLGFLLNEKKCATVPSKRRDFLGLTCDSQAMMFRVPPKKRRVFM
jgi:hypothetical protein